MYLRKRLVVIKPKSICFFLWLTIRVSVVDGKIAKIFPRAKEKTYKWYFGSCLLGHRHNVAFVFIGIHIRHSPSWPEEQLILWNQFYCQATTAWCLPKIHSTERPQVGPFMESIKKRGLFYPALQEWEVVTCLRVTYTGVILSLSSLWESGRAK